MKIKSSGFTLVELIVVVAIIGILAAIAMPIFSDYQRRAADGVALADARMFLNQSMANAVR